MAKLIGMLLIATSLLSLIAGAFIDVEYGRPTQVTGNIVTNIITQPKVNLSYFDYAEAIAFSYSIVSLIMGVVFLVRV